MQYVVNPDTHMSGDTEKPQRPVETVDEFKLRIAAIIGGKPEHIGGAPRPNPLLVRHKKRAKSKKAQRR
jgi:hypothetical protein